MHDNSDIFHSYIFYIITMLTCNRCILVFAFVSILRFRFFSVISWYVLLPAWSQAFRRYQLVCSPASQELVFSVLQTGVFSIQPGVELFNVISWHVL